MVQPLVLISPANLPDRLRDPIIQWPRILLAISRKCRTSVSVNILRETTSIKL